MMWDSKILDKQCDSTKALMLAQNLRKEEDDGEYARLVFMKPVPKEAQCLKEDGTVDLNVREFTNEELAIENRVRTNRGRTIEKLRGDKTVSTLNEEKKERATYAFLSGSTLDAIKNRFKAIMSGIKETVKYGYQARNNHED